MSWQYPVTVSDDERRARDDLRAMQFEFNGEMNKIMAIRNARRGRPGAAMPPVYFDDYYNDPEGTLAILKCYLEIEQWKELKGR